MIILSYSSGALDKAYDILTVDDSGRGICFYDFLMFMHYYKPFTRKKSDTCMHNI